MKRLLVLGMSLGLVAAMAATPVMAGVDYKSSTDGKTAYFSVPGANVFVARNHTYNGDGSPGPWEPPVVTVYVDGCWESAALLPQEFQWTPGWAAVHTVTPCGPVDIEWEATGPLERFNDWKAWSPNGVANCSPPDGDFSVHDMWLGESAPAIANGTVGYSATPIQDAPGMLVRGKTRYMECSS